MLKLRFLAASGADKLGVNMVRQGQFKHRFSKTIILLIKRMQDLRLEKQIDVIIDRVAGDKLRLSALHQLIHRERLCQFATKAQQVLPLGRMAHVLRLDILVEQR